MAPLRMLPAACLLLLLPGSFAPGQEATSDSTRVSRNEEFWNRFEVEFNRFINRVTSDFSAPSSRDSVDSFAPAAAEGRDGWVRDEGDDGIHPSFLWPRRGTVAPSTATWTGEESRMDDAIVRYNRVEGLFLGLGSEKRYQWNGERDFSPYGSVGYGFASHRWRGNLGVARQFPLQPSQGNALFEFGLEGHSLTDSKDQWRIGAGENTVSALLAREDFRDYFEREGAMIHSGYAVRTDRLFAEAGIDYLVDRYRSLGRNVAWSFFGGGKVFRENPGITEGMMRSVRVVGGLTTAARSPFGRHGWSLYGSAEFAGRRTLGGDFDFNQFLADIRRYQPLGRYDDLRVRLRVGSSHGELPPQRSYELGGPGTLPGYGFKAFPGDSAGANRMILFNMEYIVNGDFLSDLDFWPGWLMRHINFILLADAGFVRTVPSTVSFVDGFGGIGWSDFKSDVGVGISNRRGSFILGAAWRTDVAASPRLVLRIAQPF